MAARDKKYECDAHVDPEIGLSSSVIFGLLTDNDTYFFEGRRTDDLFAEGAVTRLAFDLLVRRLDVIGTHAFIQLEPSPPSGVYIVDTYGVLRPTVRKADFRVIQLLVSDRHDGYFRNEEPYILAFISEADFDRYFKGQTNYRAALRNYKAKAGGG